VGLIVCTLYYKDDGYYWPSYSDGAPMVAGKVRKNVYRAAYKVSRRYNTGSITRGYLCVWSRTPGGDRPLVGTVPERFTAMVQSWKIVDIEVNEVFISLCAP